MKNINPNFTRETRQTQLIHVLLRSAGDLPDVAAGLLVEKFGMTPAEEENLLSSGHGVFTATMTCDAALAAIVLLSTLGLVLTLGDVEADSSADLFDVSVRLTDPDSIIDVRRVLNWLGWAKEVTIGDFFGPAGLEICGLSQANAHRYAKALKTIDGVTVDLSNQTSALFDIPTPAGLPEYHMAEIRRFIWRMGRSKGRNLMIATRLDRDQMAALMARFPMSGLTYVNRAFSRFNFITIGPGDLSVEGYMKFVDRHGAAAGNALLKRQPQRLVTNLRLGAAQLLREEWIALGLEFRTELFLG